MSSMTNPMDALTSLQAEIFNGIPLRVCNINSELQMFVDQPNGRHRFTFVKVESNIIKSFATYVFVSAKNKMPCVNIGYAVPPEYRQQGLATEIVEKSLNEVKAEFLQNGISSFYVEAVIGINNVASQKLAVKLLSDEYQEIIDDVSGERANFYSCLVQ
jgi:hypothetical protein